VKPAVVALLVLAVAGPARAAAPKDNWQRAEEEWKAELRNKLEIAPVELSALKFGSAEIDHLRRASGATRREIEALEDDLSRGPSAPEKWARLGGLYSEAQQEEKARAVREKAALLLAEQARRRPEDGAVLGLLGRVLNDLGQKTEAERLLRRAVRLAPKEAEAWAALGRLLQGQGIIWLRGRTSFEVLAGADKLRERKLTAEQARQAFDCFEEALHCFGRAVRADPRSASRYTDRAMAHFFQAQARAAALAALGQPPPPPTFMDECLADVSRAVDLAPTLENLNWWFFLEAQLAHAEARLSGHVKSKDVWREVPEAARPRFREIVARLGPLCDAPDRREASRALELRGVLQGYLLGEAAAAKDSLRRAIEFDPTREQARNCLFGLCEDDPGEAVGVAKLCLQARPSGDNHFLLAHAHWLTKDARRTEAHLEAALMLQPDLFRANLSLAALLMKRGRPADLARADELLSRAERTSPEKLTRKDRMLRDFYRGAHFVLAGEMERGRELLAPLFE
jgi:tetratricopeptide (TPR) repeat protein